MKPKHSSDGKCPQIDPLLRNNSKSKTWELLNSAIQEIDQHMTYQSEFLLFQGQQGRSSRSTTDDTSSDILIKETLAEFSEYMDNFLVQLNLYFKWPEWLILTEKVFNFSLDLDLNQWLIHLGELMEIPSSPQCLVDIEKPVWNKSTGPSSWLLLT